MASSYHMERKTFIEASCKLYTLEKIFSLVATFEGLCVVSFRKNVKKL